MTSESATVQQLSNPTFTEKVNSRFEVHLQSGKSLDLMLTHVSDLKVSAGQEQFSILFRGPVDAFLPQEMYKLMHESMGSFDLFFVPVGRNENGFEYEAVFNRIHQSS